MDKLEKRVKALTEELNESKIAYKYLFNQVEADKKTLEENITYNFKLTIEPYLNKIKEESLSKSQMQYVEIIEKNMNEIVSSMNRRLATTFIQLTSMEIQIANLIRFGKTTKEIAGVLNLSDKTVATHRNNMREKLGLKNSKITLKDFLARLESDDVTNLINKKRKKKGLH